MISKIPPPILGPIPGGTAAAFVNKMRDLLPKRKYQLIG
jgi:hypothetical protein